VRSRVSGVVRSSHAPIAMGIRGFIDAHVRISRKLRES
jgi:hypothetical protein